MRREVLKRLLPWVAVLCIALQFPGAIASSALALALWVASVALVDRGLLRAMWMPRFIAITIVIALGTTLFLGKKDMALLGVPFSGQGVVAGGLLLTRSLLILGLAAYASQAIRQGRLLRALERVGLSGLGEATHVAVSLIPELRGRLAQARQGHGPFELAVAAFCETVRLAEAVSRPKVFAVVGPPGSGKTTKVLELVKKLGAAGIALGGVAQPARPSSGRRLAYDLLDIATGEQRPFAKANGTGFVFDDDGWAWARARIRDARRNKDLVVVDEIGRLEAEGKGHMPALLEPEGDDKAKVFLLAVRADREVEVQGLWGGFARRLLVGEGHEEEAFVEALIQACKEVRR